MDKIFIFLLCFYFCSAKIKINKLDVPSAILYGSQDQVVLDCDFDSGGDTVTEVKWFLDEYTQIYQWLPAEKVKAQAIGKMKSHIDVNYKATDDEKTMYRALHITDLSPEISGNYTCKVSGPMSEAQETKRMIIYVTPDENASDDDDDDEILDLTISEDTSEITCTAGGYYPAPNMTLYVINDNETEKVFQQDDEIVALSEDGFYNVSSTLKIDFSNLSQTFQYTCELGLPGTPYNISESEIHRQEDSSETQLEEELLFVLDNSTDSVVEEEKEIETQIEEDSDFVLSATENATLTDDDVTNMERQNLKENASTRYLPNLTWTLIITALLKLFYS